MAEEKKVRNMRTYVSCMILAVVILILFAAMADNRETHFENQLNEKEQTNASIQNQIVTLSDQNYNLQRELDETKKQLEEKDAQLQFLTVMNEAWVLYEEEKKEEAVQKLDTIKDMTKTEEQEAQYRMLSDLLAE